jgi:hypothetical protein
VNNQKLENQFYSPQGGWLGLKNAANQACRAGLHVNGAIFSRAKPLSSLLRYLKDSHATSRGLSVTGTKFYSIQQDLNKSDPKAIIPKVVLWEDSSQPIVYLMSCQERTIFDRISFAIHRYLSPYLCRVFLRTNEIRRGLDELKDAYSGASLRVREYTSRSLIDDPNSVKRVRTNREWTDEDYETVFQKLGEEKQWLSSLRLEMRGQQTSSGRIWRNATFSCESGFGHFFETVVGTVRQAVVKSGKFFEQRDRQTSPTHTSRPLRIVYSEDIFSDKRQNYRLIETLNQLKDSALSVYHPNPYFHASLVDYADGSSYELWVTSPSAILVVPKSKATTDSIERVCDYICDEFQEGNVQEFHS